MNPPALPPQQKCGLATASVVLGVAAIVLCPIGPLMAIPAVICGHKAQSKIKSSGGQLTGSGAALAGLITGYLSFSVFILLSVLVVPKYFITGHPPSSSECLFNLRAIQGATAAWALENRKDKTDVPKDSDLFGATQYIREKTICPLGGIYTLKGVDESPACSIHGNINSYNRTPTTGSPRH